MNQTFSVRLNDEDIAMLEELKGVYRSDSNSHAIRLAINDAFELVIKMKGKGVKK